MREPKNIVELEDVTTSVIESIISTKLEEIKSMVTQFERRQSSENHNGSTNPNPEKLAEP